MKIMCRINKTENNITKLEERLFSDLDFTNGSAQEWIAKNPDVLGEKDFFTIRRVPGIQRHKRKTRSSLHLTKEGSIVVIENKLDDWEGIFVWQALNTPVSRFNRSNRKEIYQDTRYV